MKIRSRCFKNTNPLSLQIVKAAYGRVLGYFRIAVRFRLYRLSFVSKRTHTHHNTVGVVKSENSLSNQFHSRQNKYIFSFFLI